ncbi:MAG: hypothetical protein OXL36_11420 [Bryobacterales bacterium]|nr:hypothetical protein [Bryobacterales bacterium]MDE0293136.1 hypothetical protein [Bryobacterales bacterium]MDE0428567.1 hypothetical protein [Caldilineaceae bacterium]
MIVAALTRLAGDIVGRYQARKAVKAASAARIEQKRADLEVTRIEAEIARARRTDTADADYDLQVLRNRERSWADEVLIGIFTGIFILPFIDALQATWTGRRLGLAEAVADGWAAHGYDGAPWWFEFAMVGILVSTLGLFRLIRMWSRGREQVNRPPAETS